MANIWTYQGETGKRLDASVRPFEVFDPLLGFGVLEDDRLTYFLRLQELIPGSEIYPQEGQTVTLFRNGQRFFQGTAQRPDQQVNTVGIQVLGPWAWLEKMGLSTDVTLDAASGGGTGQRATYGFAAQNMTDSLGALFDRCIALGAPFQKGTIASVFACLPVTLNGGTFAQALTRLVQLIGDMSVWFDYSGSGRPRVNVTRRLSGLAVGTSPIVTFDAGELEDLSITPRDEMRVTQVRVPYLSRAASGARLFQEQKAGTAELGHVLLLTASGEELDTFLPNDGVATYSLETSALTTSALKNWVMTRDSNIAAAAQAANMAPTALPLGVGPASLQFANPSTGLPALNKTVQVLAPRFLDSNGQGVNTSGMQLIKGSDTPPDWMNALYTIVPVTVTGSLYYEFKETDYVNQVATNHYPVPTWWYGVQWSGTDGGGFRGTTSNNYGKWQVFIHNFEIQGYLINTTASFPTTIYEPPKYEFIAPPAGFAQGLLNARNWTPHSGTIGWTDQECGESRYLGKVVNVTGADPTWGTMRAMIQREELNIETGKTKLVLGPPARFDFASLLDSTPANSAQQIRYL
jgi:hypothetical protein